MLLGRNGLNWVDVYLIKERAGISIHNVGIDYIHVSPTFTYFVFVHPVWHSVFFALISLMTTKTPYSHEIMLVLILRDRRSVATICIYQIAMRRVFLIP